MRHFLSELYNRALYYLSVPKCISCNEILDYEEGPLCNNCMREYLEQKKRNCSRCSRVLQECTCSNFYLERHYIKKLAKVYRYTPANTELPGNLLVYSLKHDNRRDTFAFLARELSAAIKQAVDIEGNESSFVITNVPRRPAAIRRDGYDHSRILARRIAKLLEIEYKQFLRSKAKRAQRETRGDDRRKNAVFEYKRGAQYDFKGKTAIIVDDVVTTGSSMASCATLLRGMGAKKIMGAAVSIAYKDSYVKPISSRS